MGRWQQRTVARPWRVALGTVLAAVTLLAADGRAPGEPVFVEAFDSPALPAWIQAKPSAWRLVDGALQTLDGQRGMATFEVGNLAVQDWRLTLRVKRLAVPATDQHFGIIFSYADGTSLRLYCRGKTVHYWDQAGNKALAHEGLGGELSPPLPSGPDAPWTTVRITTRAAYVQFDLDDRVVGRVRREPAVLQAMQCYAYRLDCAFDDLRLERLATALPGDEPVPTSPPRLALHADFEGSAVLHTEPGDAEPLAAKGLTFTDGVLGQAVRVSTADGAQPLLQYAAGEAFKGPGGTVMFWFRPEWDGAIADPQHFPWYGLFSTLDAAGKVPLRIWQWNWLRADLARGDDLKGFSLNNRCRGSWLKGDWHHVALTWNEDGWCTLYADGVPYERGLTGGNYLPQREEASLAAVRSFSLGSTPERGGAMRTADGAFDELRLYGTPLPASAILAEVHRACPVDLIVERRFVRAAAPAEVVMELHPGGAMVIPAVGPVVTGPIPVTLRCQLTAEGAAHVLAAREFSGAVDAEVRVSLAVPPLAAGDYRLTCSLVSGKATIQRSFKIVAYALTPARRASLDGLSLGDPTVAIAAGADLPTLLSSAPTVVNTLAGVAYREAGPDKADRFAFPVEFAEAMTRGEPVLLEVVWPDDRPRSMGLYMYPESTRKEQRDRLEGGIQSGDEVPLSGTLQTARYLFYPDRQRYLFEARTMVTGMPAAVASLTVRPLTAPLPCLAITRPEGATHRRLGHLDEDQSFEILYRRDDGSAAALRQLEALCDYFDYTGQELISYPLLRYHGAFYPTVGTYPGGGLRPEGWIDLFLQVLGQRGKQLIGIVNLYTVPELYLFPARVDALIEAGAFVRDAQGDLVRGHSGYRCNPLHPMVRAAFLRNVDEVLRRYGDHPAFAGLDLWLNPTWTWTTLEHGYDDDTVARFAADTGTAVPTAEGRERYRARYAFLTGPARAAWLAWRAKQTTALLSEVDRRARATRPGLPVYVSLSVAPWTDESTAPDLAARYYRDYALDVEALRQLPALVMAPQRHPTAYRHGKHWDRSENRYDEVAFDRAQTGAFRAPGRATTGSFLTYFESFNDSLQPEVYASYFQNADVKAHGRFFLQEWAFCLASLDATQMLIGAQPLGTAGRDDVVREFARAYGALPATAFADAVGPADPVTVRYLDTPAGTYLYAVNTLGFPLRADVQLARDASGMDLSTGAAVATQQQRLAVDLLPFQLRSFRLSGAQPSAPVATVVVPAATVAWYRERVDEVERDIHDVAATGADVAALQWHAGALRRAVEAGAYAEAHRLRFAKTLRELGPMSRAATEGFLATRTQMLAKSTYAVNCGMGGISFYRAANGTLFLPDQEFTPGSYGHVGSGYKSVTRSTSDITGTADPTLYASEAYDLEGYRFAVKPGRYTVRLYLKVGYKPGAKPGVFVMNIDLEGTRVLDKADLFLLCESDFNRAIAKEFHGVAVTDGVLDIGFGIPDGGEPTARLCNAIEVIPEP